jgi:hypothetical protein
MERLILGDIDFRFAGSMGKEKLERLLKDACDLLIIFDGGNVVSDSDRNKISAIFSEIKYSEELDNEMNICADQYLNKQEIIFSHNDNDYVIEFDVQDQDFWVTIDGWDIHYCENYNEICVYEYGNYRKSVYSRNIKG